MRGKFRYSNVTLFVFSLIGLLMSVSVFTALSHPQADLSFQQEMDIKVIAMVFAVTMFGIMLLAIYVPCGYEADESGVKIRCGLITRRFAYGEIRAVETRTYPEGHGRYGGTIYSAELIIATEKGKSRFEMYAGTFHTEDALRDPKGLQARIDDNAFAHLAEHIRAHMR